MKDHLEDCLKPCLDSIMKTTDLLDKEIIIVMNGSNKTTREYVESLNVKALWFDEPLGAPRAYNEGIAVSTGNYIILLNDDVVILRNDWVDLLLEPFSDSSVGITGVLKFTIPVGKNSREAFAFWCVMIRDEVFEKIGPLDEIFYPFGCEDMDFCIKASNAGYKLVQVPQDTAVEFLGQRPTTDRGLFKGDFPIFHHGSKTIDSHFENFEKKKILEAKNLKIIYERYGG